MKYPKGFKRIETAEEFPLVGYKFVFENGPVGFGHDDRVKGNKLDNMQDSLYDRDGELWTDDEGNLYGVETIWKDDTTAPGVWQRVRNINNLNETDHEAGIVIYDNENGNSEVIILNWYSYKDDELPKEFYGMLINYRHENGIKIKRVKNVQDVREILPEDGEVLYDYNNDWEEIFDENEEMYIERGRRGTEWEVEDENGEKVATVVTIEHWN